ncbi:thyroid transcription factor 1-associated protein 26 homolog [Ctenopharyngodon idella]|uniref:thyroid transcription factor 1-associated protein 26 homolog n=1 Tax=Ctenopharyngodon idella TaxID=7959 RepID=UPI002231C33C|nr:thyroid transcription factor 1-associated protein 26 homolog [Ctenopharyngodon idella]
MPCDYPYVIIVRLYTRTICHVHILAKNMAPLKQNAKSQGPFRGKYLNNKFAHGGLSHNAKRKRKWVPEDKIFDGSLKEGQGFAFKRKEKVRHEYNKLLRKERKKKQASKVQLEEKYPEHLKHLYLAERKRLDEEEQEKKIKRFKGRELDEETEEDDELNIVSDSSEKSILNATTDQTTVPDSSNEPTQSDSSHKVPLIQKKLKMSSYQKTKQEYERMKEERARKREEFLKNKSEREEALKKYKEKKMATYQLLKRKTKKGQPNLNLQMELLLHKIQAQRK